MIEVLMVAVVFFAIFQVLKNFTDFLLKRMIIKTGHIENAGILEQKVSSASTENEEVNKYPSLKWGLVTFFGGIGFIVINQLIPSFVKPNGNLDIPEDTSSMLALGIELVSISLGFIIYFLIVNFTKKK